MPFIKAKLTNKKIINGIINNLSATILSIEFKYNIIKSFTLYIRSKTFTVDPKKFLRTYKLKCMF